MNPGPRTPAPKRRNAARAALSAVALLGLTAALALAASRGTPTTVQLGKGSALWLEGGSNIHAWESRTATVDVSLWRGEAASDPADAAGLEALVRDAGVTGFEVKVPVRTLKSKKDGLDKNLYKAMEADAHPDVRFTLASYTVTGRDGDTLRVSAPGSLLVHGVTREVTLTGRMWKDDAGLWLAGVHPVKMTDHGIKPPTMMMGTLRTRDRVDVHYRLLLIPSRS
jgi:polyisoprenoid-binding protein YceI